MARLTHGDRCSSDSEEILMPCSERAGVALLLSLALLLLAPPAPAGEEEAEKKALATVERLGGQVIRGESKAGKPVRQVTLLGKEVTDAAVKDLVGLKELDWLNLNDTKVTDAGLKDVVQLK